MRRAAQLYNVPFSSLRSRIAGATPAKEFRPKSHNLDELEETVLVKHILDLDDRGFSPRLEDVEDMANYILASLRETHPRAKDAFFTFLRLSEGPMRRPEAY